MKKTILLVIILLAFYVQLLLNAPAEGIKKLGYNSLLQIYAENQLKNSQIKVLYNPGLRNLNIDLQKAAIKPCLPPYNESFSQIMEEFLDSDVRVIVECSALDSWHSSTEGSRYLQPLREKAYRVVIFDGGHHLPTLGLSPDIIIVPVYKGYAAHGYMRDGMKVSNLLALLQDSHSNTALVTVSRWQLVKNKDSLTGITRQAIRLLTVSQTEPAPVRFQCQARVSKYSACFYIYIAGEYIRNPDLLVKRCRQLGIQDVKEILVAFDYGSISREKAEQYRRKLQKNLSLNVTTVNQPLRVTDLFFMNE